MCFSFTLILDKYYTVPVLYCLLMNKTKRTYIEMWNLIKSAVVDKLHKVLTVNRVIIDFEMAMISTVKHLFRDCIINLCWFHLCKNIRQ